MVAWRGIRIALSGAEHDGSLEDVGVASGRPALFVLTGSLVASFVGLLGGAGCISLASLGNGPALDGAATPDAPGAPGDAGSDLDGGGGDAPVTPSRAQAYRDAVMADRPVGYWRFDETEGTTAKDEVGAHDGVYTFSPVLGRPGIFGESGAVELSSTAHVEVPGSAFSFGGVAPYTVEVWVKPKVFTNYQLIASTETSPPRTGWSVFASESGEVDYEVWRPNDAGSPEVRSLSSNKALALDRFQHVVVTYNGNIMRVYIDGASANSNPSPREAYDTEGLLFGCRRNNGTVINCLGGWALDEAAIYDYPLTADRVLAHYQLGEP
jgi:hypothetical protein